MSRHVKLPRNIVYHLILYKDPEAQALLGDELTHTPEPCASIIRKTYFSDMTDAEIAEEAEIHTECRVRRNTHIKSLFFIGAEVAIYIAVE